MLSKLIILALAIVVCKAQYFTAKNGKIYDAKGSEFLIRGINSAHADWDNYNRNYAYDSIPNIANTGANTIRVQWRRNLQGSLTRTNLENIIKRAIQYKMAVILQLHDATGSDNTNDLYECAKWFKDNVDLLWTYKQYLIVNIANEWSPWGTSFEKWRDAYKQAISTIRSTGWNGLLLIDGSAYAQNPDSIIKYGNELVNSDPAKNVAFSLHMYAEWKKVGGNFNIGNKLWDIQQKGLTIVVGEFALEHPDGCHWEEIDGWEIMRQCKWKNIGYLGWSWQGNGSNECNVSLDKLNMVTGNPQSGKQTWTHNNYSNWGNAIVWYTEYGIKATSKPATVFA